MRRRALSGKVTDSFITSDEPFKLVNFGTFIATTPGTASSVGTAQLTAPAITTFGVTENMTGDLNLTGEGYSTFPVMSYKPHGLGLKLAAGDVNGNPSSNAKRDAPPGS